MINQRIALRFERHVVEFEKAALKMRVLLPEENERVVEKVVGEVLFADDTTIVEEIDGWQGSEADNGATAAALDTHDRWTHCLTMGMTISFRYYG